MGITEKRQLEKLVVQDYDVLGKEMDQYTAELIRTRQQEINEEFANRQGDIEDLTREWDELRARWQAEYRDFCTRVRERGLGIGADRYNGGRDLLSTGHASFTVPGKQQALDDVERDVKIQMRRAKTALERKKVETIRQILVAGLAEEATKLLTSMPDPRELVVQAMRDSQNPRLALTLGIPAAAPEAAPAPAQGDGEIVEGLVVNDAENMADRV